MKNKKVAVTGGLGFIGSHLVEELSRDNQVVVIDNESSGHVKNIMHLSLDNISLDLGDINQVDLMGLFEDVDYLFHQAALASVPLSVENPFLCNEINITGTLNVLDAALKSGVKKVMFASSSAVYGDNENFPLSEDEPLNPKSPYAASKAAGELYCQVYNEVYDLPTVTLRYFNVFGPRQDPESQYAAVIPIFIDKILKNEVPVIYGDGEQTRDFVHVKQVVDANIMSAQSKEKGVFNIGLGKSTTINQLFDIIKESMDTDIEPAYEDERSGEIKHSVADISKARSIGYSPKNDFKDDLIETVNWFNG
ncbi:MAG: SDR family oxidoreductase [Methanobacteriaceae archaeon]|nr:SDR family oxidoreductase [Methanobacteriaceae archaeon]